MYNGYNIYNMHNPTLASGKAIIAGLRFCPPVRSDSMLLDWSPTGGIKIRSFVNICVLYGRIDLSIDGARSFFLASVYRHG